MISRIETISDLIAWTERLKEESGSLLVQVNVLDPIQEWLKNLDSTATYKKCIKCSRVWLATKEWFDWCGRGRDGLHPICKFCRNRYQKKYKKLRKEEARFHPGDLDTIQQFREQQGGEPIQFPKHRKSHHKKPGITTQEALQIQADGLGGQKHD